MAALPSFSGQTVLLCC